MRWRVQRFWALAAVLLLTGCSSIGPATIKRDRGDYSSAMANSWKEMQLLNIVKYRYFDPPVFLDVPSVISQQQLYARAQASSQLFPTELTNVAGTQDFYNLMVQGRYIDRPTISYTPITGQAFVDLLLRPIAPATILAMIDTGYPAGFVLSRTVASINQIYNYALYPTHFQPEDPRFLTLLAAFVRLQHARAVAAQTVDDGEKPRTNGAGRPAAANAAEDRRPVTTLYFRRHATPAADQDIRLVKSLLGLDPRRDAFRIISGPRHTPEEIAVNSRSAQTMLQEFAAGVDIPGPDLAVGRAVPIPAIAPGAQTPPLIHIHSGPARPADTYCAVYYQDHWFWIDNNDLESKLDFLFLTVFFALAQTGSITQTPLVTVSAGQ